MTGVEPSEKHCVTSGEKLKRENQTRDVESIEISRIEKVGLLMRSETILVIEDNELNMKLVKGLIKIGKYRMLEAKDAESGIELVREHRPDLILMDIQLPGMDGLCATKIIKEDPYLKDIPVVALTSYAMQGDKEKALEAGCAGYIAKPIDTRKFLETVSQFFR